MADTADLPGGLVRDREVDGVYGRGETFERVITALDGAIATLVVDAQPVALRFPPVLARRTIERCGYLHTFPHLLATVYSFSGDTSSHAKLVEAADSGGDWSPFQQMTDVILTPAACYAVYPHFSGTLPDDGVTIDVESWCFRQEPSNTPERMRSFRMREFVRLGSPETVRRWREAWIERAERFLQSLGLTSSLAPASDPFFGDAATFLKSSQEEQQLKFELSVDVRAATRVATISCNYHLDHFGSVFDIHLRGGASAHSGCVAFGLERLTLALFFAHGPSPVGWPTSVLDALQLTHA
jgi:seryl-tRNA synthetase